VNQSPSLAHRLDENNFMATEVAPPGPLSGLDTSPTDMGRFKHTNKNRYVDQQIQINIVDVFFRKMLCNSI
jgi:hypothetical protein